MAIEGSIEIQVVPSITGFEAALRSQLQPIIGRIEGLFTPAFSKAGTSAGQSFAANFARQVNTQIGSAVQSAAGSRQVADAGKQVAAQFGQGLTTAAPAVSKGVGDAVEKATAATTSRVRAAGEVSGRTFGSGFGEGFAALAAFAISFRVFRFFKETVSDATDFETAFAGVRRVLSEAGDTVQESAVKFNALRKSIIDMSERLPFTASSIADVVAEAGRLGVPIANVQKFSETILKFATITGQAPEAVATSFAKFASVTQTPIEQTEHLADVVLKLGTAFAANETEILDFSRRLAPLAALTKATGEDVLALATGIVQAGGRAESGGTAIVQAFDNIQKAASQGGSEAKKFADTLNISTDAFRSLVATDPTEVFVRLLEALRNAGADSAEVLRNLDLGSRRVSVQLRALAATSNFVRDALDASKNAAGELNKQFNIFSATPAERLKVLQNELQNTRIEIGNKLAPAIIGLLKPIAGLSTGTVTLGAAFAGLAAGGFAFVRFGNILRQFSSSLGGAALSAEEVGLAMQIAQTRGTTLSGVIKVLAQQQKGLAEAQTILISQDEALTAEKTKLIAAFEAEKVNTLGLVGAFKAVQVEQEKLIAAQVASGQASLAASEEMAVQRLVAATLGPQLNTVSDAVILNTRAMLAQAEAAQVANTGLLATVRTAIQASGGFGGLVSSLGKLAGLAIVVDIITQLERGLHGFFETALRGQENIDATTLAMKKLFAGTGEVSDVLKKARVDLGTFSDLGLKSIDELGNIFVTGPVAGLHLLGNALEETGIPGIENLGSAVRSLSSTATDVINKIPFLGRVITTESERATAKLADLNKGLVALFDQSPEAARAVFNVVTDALKNQGTSQNDVNKGLAEFIKKSKDAAAAQDFLQQHSEDVIAALRAQGLSEEEVAEQAIAMGISMDGASGSLAKMANASESAKAALSRLHDAQQQLQERVKALILPVSGLIAAQQKLQKAGSGAAKDTLRSARAIADAEKALADARREANQRLADAQRRLADAEVEAARRIIDARRRLDESRLDSTRRLRDAQEELQDFQRALETVGGARTEEDLIRLRELQEALADATQDAAQKELEGQRAVADARREGNEQIADANRKLQETIEENTRRIADALQRLARAHEDAANRSTAAASKIEKAVILSVSQITKGFQQQANKLNQFADLMTTAQTRIFKAFGDQNLGEAFLADLNDMGVDAIPILRNLVKASDGQLAGLGKAFENQIKAAKRAADFQFKRFPPNFKAAIKPAVDNIFIEMERGIGAFDILSDKSGDMATEISTNLQNLTLEFDKLVQESGVQLTAVQQKFLDLAESTDDPTTRVAALKQLIGSLRSRDLSVDVQVRGLEKLRELAILQGQTSRISPLRSFLAETGFSIKLSDAVGALGTKSNPMYVHGVGGAALGATINGWPHAQFGATFSSGQPIITGEAGRELFVPNSGGAIFRNSDTEKILRALRVVRRSVVQYVTVNEVAQDPRATARAVSFAIGSDGAVR